MNSDKKKITIRLLAFVGFILTIKLAMIYYYANYDKYSLSSFCSINDFIDCDGAAKTNVSQVFGIPLAYWGMFFYLVVMFLTFVDRLKNVKFLKFLEVFKAPMAYITFLGTFAFLISMVLAGFSLFVIHKLCILCVITYLVDFLIAIIASDSIKDYFISFKTTFVDFIAGIKSYPKTFIILFISFVSFITYSGLTDNFVPHVKRSKNIKKYAKMLDNPYKINGNTLGSENADVVIELYSDFVCPLCYIQNIMLHQAVTKYSNIKVIHHNLPFDKECNPLILMNVHPGACYFARAAIAAGKQGNYWGMSTLLYSKHPVGRDELTPYLKDLGIEPNKFFKDMSSNETIKELSDEIKKINDELGLDATPTMFVNGDKHVGIMSYDELCKYLEEHGAKTGTR